MDFACIRGHAPTAPDRLQPDRRIINLETSITASDDWQPKGINDRRRPANVSCLTAAHIDCCVLARNPVLGWGKAALAEMLAVLARQAIQTAGAGHSLPAALAPAILPAGKKAACWCSHPAPPRAASRRTGQLRPILPASSWPI